jgi:hypothetical protein
MQRTIDPNQLSEDWVGNNIAVTCPLCKKVFVVSAHLNRAGRKCPKCGRSTAIVGGISGETQQNGYLDAFFKRLNSDRTGRLEQGG